MRASAAPLAFVVALASSVVSLPARAQFADANDVIADAGDVSGDAATVSIPTSGASDSDAGVFASAPDSGLPRFGITGFAAIMTEADAAVHDARPDPTADQLEALRVLEEEVRAFAERGDAYRRSIHAILQREHDLHLERLRHGYERQINAERVAEAEARRHAIQVFERFLELYPADADHTPDVMFRLAELYYDEAAYAQLDAEDRLDRLRAERAASGQAADDLVSQPVDYRCSILLYRNIIRRFPAFRLQDATHYLIGWVLKEMGHEDESITAYRGMVCPSRFHYELELDLNAPLLPGQESPVACPHLFEILRPHSADLVTPSGSTEVAIAGDGGATAPTSRIDINASMVPPPSATDKMMAAERMVLLRARGGQMRSPEYNGSVTT